MATVKAELARLGIDPRLMRTVASGDSQQVQGCERLKRRAELRECLLPNRRVEMVIQAQRP